MSNRVVVMGAGSIGCFLGGALTLAGANVTLVGRPRLQSLIREHGLTLTDLKGRHESLSADRLNFATDPAVVGEADLVLVCVKSRNTLSVAEDIARAIKPSALVISFQNGLDNAARLRSILPNQTVLAGIVPFNVVQLPQAVMHRGTEGELMIEASSRLLPWLTVFAGAGIPLKQRRDIVAVQWGKLLLNLNNPVNALANIPLREELAQRDYRRCLALLVEEALRVLHAAGIHPAASSKVPPALLPRLLPVPDFLFRRLAGAMLRIDPTARSSMWEDLAAGRPTEIDDINGAVVQLAARTGSTAPANAAIVGMIHAMSGRPPESVPASTLLQRLKQATVRSGG